MLKAPFFKFTLTSYYSPRKEEKKISADPARDFHTESKEMNGEGDGTVRSKVFPFQPQKIRLLTKNIFIRGKCLFPLSFGASVSARNQFLLYLFLLFLKERERESERGR